MALDEVKALTFDTGGTILDWHTGFSDALALVGKRHGLERDWHQVANDVRRASLRRVLNLGQDTAPAFTFDGAHRAGLDEVIASHGLEVFTEEDRHYISYDVPHSLTCWPDFPSVLPKLRERYICASFTLLSYRIIMDTGRTNGLSWDAVFSCEGIGKYKVLPEAYQAVVGYLQLQPHEICMVACHNFDLEAAKKEGYKTAFVRRPFEWGRDGDGPPDPEPNPHHDIVVDDFPSLAAEFGVRV